MGCPKGSARVPSGIDSPPPEQVIGTLRASAKVLLGSDEGCLWAAARYPEGYDALAFVLRYEGPVEKDWPCLMQPVGIPPSGGHTTKSPDVLFWNTLRKLVRPDRLKAGLQYELAHKHCYFFTGAGFHCHFSSKKPASATPPGPREVRGWLRSMTAQSGSLATWRALFR